MQRTLKILNRKINSIKIKYVNLKISVRHIIFLGAQIKLTGIFYSTKNILLIERI